MLTVDDGLFMFLAAREAQGLTQTTLDIYQQRLGLFCKHVNGYKLAQVSPADVDKYLVMLRRRQWKYVNNPYRPPENGGLAPATIEGIKMALKVFFKWCVERDLIDKSPAAHLRKQKFSQYARKRAMNPETLMQMLEYVRLAARARNPIDIRDLALLSFVADSLARVGEVSSMNIQDVDFNRSFVDVNEFVVYEAAVTGKVGERLVTFSEQTALYMLDWLEVRPEVETASFFVAICRNHFRERHPRCTACRVFGNRMTTNSMSLTFKRIAKRCGAEGKVNPHSIRHLGGIVYAERAGIEIAQEKLGHTSIMTTRLHYVPSNRDRVRSETARLSPVENRPD